MQLDYVLGMSAYPLVIGFDGDAAGRESTARLVSSAAQPGSTRLSRLFLRAKTQHPGWLVVVRAASAPGFPRD
jgi:hypothetical protein